MGDGGVDLHGFQGLLLLLGGGLVLHGAHVVEPVGNFDEDDPDVLAHGDEHFPEVLHLLVLFGGVLDPGQLADALHQVRHGGRGELGHVLIGGGGVLNDIVEQRRLDRLGVQMQFLRHDLGHGQGVGDIGLAAFAALVAVLLFGKFIGSADMVKIRAGIVRPDGIFQMLVLFIQCHCMSPRFMLRAVFQTEQIRGSVEVHLPLDGIQTKRDPVLL